MYKKWITMAALALMAAFVTACDDDDERELVAIKEAKADTPVYFNLRPKLELTYGYTHAVRIGDDIKISGAVSMDDEGTLLGPGDMAQQMKNCYADLEKVLAHFGCTWKNVVVENVFTTNMASFIEVSGYRAGLYGTKFPSGTWLEVKGLALPGQLIEIDMEAHIQP